MKPDKARDTEDMDDLRRLYAQAPAEAPPPALDHAVLAHARAAVQARPQRRWGPPLATAAVLLLSVAVVFDMERERPEVMSATGSVAPQPAAPAGPMSAEPTSAKPAASARGPAGAERKPESGPMPRGDAAAAPPLHGAEKSPAADRASAVQELALPRREALAPVPAMSAQSGAAEQAPGIGVPSAGAGESEFRSRSPAGAGDAAGMSRPQSARSLRRADARGEAGEAAMKSAAELPPEQWLARLAELRAQGRMREFEEGLAEFRKRHPGYRIPDSLLAQPAQEP